ncbi:MAG: hypothetical protein JWQ88_360 [Rhodoferax sp.]|nr:hypothetical protein [Rhodoferax sp.]
MSTAINRSGDGTRSTTDAGVDNIGAGEKFAGGKSATGEPNTGPAPHERLQEKRADVESSKRDDSVPFFLRGDPSSKSNVEPGDPPK